MTISRIVYELTTKKTLLALAAGLLLTTVGDVNVAAARKASSETASGARYVAPDGSYSFVPPLGFRFNAQLAAKTKINRVSGVDKTVDGVWDGPNGSRIASSSYPVKRTPAMDAKMLDSSKKSFTDFYHGKILLARLLAKGKDLTTVVIGQYVFRSGNTPIPSHVVAFATAHGNRSYGFVCVMRSSDFKRIGAEFNQSMATVRLK